MKLNSFTIAIAVVTLFFFSDVDSLFSQNLIYSSPKDKSEYNMENTTILMGFETHQSHPENIRVRVLGSESGYHKGKIKIIENNPTKILFTPDSPFKLGEKVTVSGYNHSQKFIFYIREHTGDNIKDYMTYRINTETSSLKPIDGLQYNMTSKVLDTLPNIVINQYGTTSPGSLFLANFSNSLSVTTYLMILNNDGTPRHSQRLRFRGLDFKRQNDYYIYWDEDHYQYRALDSAFNEVDSFYCGNGYITDFHECQLEPDNSAWVISYDPQTVDMSQIYPGGQTNASVVGLIIQKIDNDKDVVFQWRSWDYFSILDATHENFTAMVVDYVHGNSLDVDKDGNIVISSRHLDEITKINTETGDIMWRLGGKNNQFDFINDTAKFSHQHSARMLANDNLLLFDNGNFHTPNYSRAVEYKLFINERKAEEVWEYRNNPEIYSYAMGNVQRLPNGNTLIGWGMFNTTLSEVNSNKELLYTLSLPAGQWSYRAFRYNTIDVLTNISPAANLLSKYQLQQNYPNPFNPVTNISFDIPKKGFVSLKVYNLLGREVSTLVNQKINPGSYTVKFDGSNFSSGIYFYRIETEGYTETRKMMLIK